MIEYVDDRVHCAGPTCDQSFPDHKWGHIRAHRAGWFETKEDVAYCPSHIPEWVKDWRESQKKST